MCLYIIEVKKVLQCIEPLFVICKAEIFLDVFSQKHVRRVRFKAHKETIHNICRNTLSSDKSMQIIHTMLTNIYVIQGFIAISM